MENRIRSTSHSSHRIRSSSFTRRTRRRSYSRSPSSSLQRRRRQDRYPLENNRSHLRARAEIAKSISTEFIVGLDTEKQTIPVVTLDDRYFGSLEEDEQPPFLKGIDSFHDMGKSDENNPVLSFLWFLRDVK
jgi:hypothetical protein